MGDTLNEAAVIRRTLEGYALGHFARDDGVHDLRPLNEAERSLDALIGRVRELAERIDETYTAVHGEAVDDALAYVEMRAEILSTDDPLAVLAATVMETRAIADAALVATFKPASVERLQTRIAVLEAVLEAMDMTATAEQWETAAKRAVEQSERLSDENDKLLAEVERLRQERDEALKERDEAWRLEGEAWEGKDQP